MLPLLPQRGRLIGSAEKNKKKKQSSVATTQEHVFDTASAVIIFKAHREQTEVNLEISRESGSLCLGFFSCLC